MSVLAYYSFAQPGLVDHSSRVCVRSQIGVHFKANVCQRSEFSCREMKPHEKSFEVSQGNKL